MYDGTGPQNVQPSDILRFTPATGTFTTFIKDAGSNGLAISRDGTSNADGSTGPRGDFASLGGTDGGTVDCAGNVYQATFGDGKVHVFSPAGQSLGTISAGRNATNVAFGGPDRTTLYITSGTPSSGGNTGNFGLYSIHLNVPGWPY